MLLAFIGPWEMLLLAFIVVPAAIVSFHSQEHKVPNRGVWIFITLVTSAWPKRALASRFEPLEESVCAHQLMHIHMPLGERRRRSPRDTSFSCSASIHMDKRFAKWRT